MKFVDISLPTPLPPVRSLLRGSLSAPVVDREGLLAAGRRAVSTISEASMRSGEGISTLRKSLDSILQDYAECAQRRRARSQVSLFRLLNFCPLQSANVPLIEKPAELKAD